MFPSISITFCQESLKKDQVITTKRRGGERGTVKRTMDSLYGHSRQGNYTSPQR